MKWLNRTTALATYNNFSTYEKEIFHETFQPENPGKWIFSFWNASSLIIVHRQPRSFEISLSVSSYERDDMWSHSKNSWLLWFSGHSIFGMTAHLLTFSSHKLMAVLARRSNVDVDIVSRMVRLVRFGHCRAINNNKLSMRSSNDLGEVNSGISSCPYLANVYLYMSTMGMRTLAVICVSGDL